MYPFKQIRKNDTIIREFTADVSSEELVWHRDLFDRRVQVLEGNEWYIQIDNQVPKKIIEGKTYFIPAHNYHRLIKGKGKLVVSIQENKENTVKITKRQLRRVIIESIYFQMGGPTDNHDADMGNWDDPDDMTGFGYYDDYDDFGDIGESKKRLVEYEQYVDEDGNVYDDEGNVVKRGKAFGRRYGGGTYGLRGLPRGGRSRRKTSYVGADANSDQIAAVEAALSVKPNNFLKSILDQLKKGRGLSPKQKGIVRKILMKTDENSAALFEGKNEMHRCMDGRMVPGDSEDCLMDISNRIEDAEHHRNSHSCGTENRVYYNGLLKGLRKKRNRLKKSLFV